MINCNNKINMFAKQTKTLNIDIITDFYIALLISSRTATPTI